MIIFTILFILLSNAVTLKRDLSILFNRITIIALIYCIIQDFTSLFFFNKGISLHGGLLNITSISQTFHIFIFIISILIIQLTSFYPKFNNKTYNIIGSYKFSKIKEWNYLRIIEYPLILLFIITGAIFLMSTNDLISIFISIELQSYGLYILSTIYRNSELSTTGGLIYFLLGGLSSCFILLGTSLIYANSGITNLDGLYVITNISNINDIDYWYKPYYINFSLLILSIGFLFKVSAAPFHFWSPDVYDAIPTIVTVFVAIIAKISIFIFLLQLIYYTSNNFSFNYELDNINWTISLLLSSLFSLIIGTVVGLTQYRIKRLFAYSTISHIGFILLALSISSIESIQAFIFYLIQYSISNLNLFLILIAIGFSFYFYVSKNKNHEELTDKINSPVQLISQIKGYFYINPMLSLSLAITMFSFMGIPPMIGFFGKQMVLSAALDKGFIFLSIVAIITSVIGAVYYLNIVKEMFFYNTDYKLIDSLTDHRILTFSKLPVKGQITMSSSINFTISIITLIILLFILFSKEWLSMSTILVQILFNN